MCRFRSSAGPRSTSRTCSFTSRIAAAGPSTPLVESWLDILFANGSLAWNFFGTTMSPTLTNAQIEDRKIYNTRMYSQSNTGHEFTDVLTDEERIAIIEYLKTL